MLRNPYLREERYYLNHARNAAEYKSKKITKLNVLFVGTKLVPKHKNRRKISAVQISVNYKDSINVKIGNRLAELIGKIGTDTNLIEEEQRLRVIDYYIKILEKSNFINEILRLSNHNEK